MAEINFEIQLINYVYFVFNPLIYLCPPTIYLLTFTQTAFKLSN